jgi:hypothetical protein
MTNRHEENWSLDGDGVGAGSTAIAETTPGDKSDAIKKGALDYIEDWYAGDAARMAEIVDLVIRQQRD